MGRCERQDFGFGMFGMKNAAMLAMPAHRDVPTFYHQNMMMIYIAFIE